MTEHSKAASDRAWVLRRPDTGRWRFVVRAGWRTYVGRLLFRFGWEARREIV